MLFLQIIGGMVVFIVLVAILFYLYLKYKFGRWLNVDESKNYSPLSIHLNEDLYPQWIEEAKNKKVISQIEAHGFRVAKSFSIPEMDEVQLLSFIKEPHTAVLYNHEIAGTWIDLYTVASDGHEYTVSNAPLGAGMNQRPDTTKSFMKNASLDEMMEEFFKLIENKKLKAIEEDMFRLTFEEAYAKDIKWKNRNGGISYEEFLSVANEGIKGKNSKEKLKEAFIETKKQELEQWHMSVLESYTDQNKLDGEDIYDLEYQSIIVPEKTDPVSYAYYLKDNGFIHDNVNLEKLAAHFRGEVNIENIFKSLNERLSPDLRAIKKGSYKHPLPIDLYMIPEKGLEHLGL